VSATAQTKSSGAASCITNVLGKSGGVVETGGSGRSSEDGRDMITLSEQRARGSRRSLSWPEAGWLMMPAESQEGSQATKVMPNQRATEGMRTWCFTSAALWAGHG
jgi:hypothetical protein